MSRLSIMVPPLLLLLVGAMVYIVVEKVTAPKSVVITAEPSQPQTASASAKAAPSSAVSETTIEVTSPSQAQLQAWQKAAANKTESWRLTPALVAKRILIDQQLATEAAVANQVERSEGTSVIRVAMSNNEFILTLKQPVTQGEAGIWVVESIVVKPLHNE